MPQEKEWKNKMPGGAVMLRAIRVASGLNSGCFARRALDQVVAI
tara:strand:- start:127 stop:258 length:132 start_codon:yes stop_codon:yes gene_type:complete